MKKKVVMQIIPGLESGGVERGTIDIAKALKNSGEFVSIVVSKGGALVHQLREAGIQHIDLPVHSKNPITIFLNIKRLIKVIQEFKVDIVHVRSRAPMWSAYFACKKTGSSLVATVHGVYSLGRLPFKRWYNSIMLKADRVIVVSGFVKKYLLSNYPGNYSDKVTIIQRGVDLKYFNTNTIFTGRIISLIRKWGLPEDKKIILMPARITGWKGHEFLIKALSRVKNDFFCVMVGSDHGHESYTKKLSSLIVNQNLAGKIKIVGVSHDMLSTYALAHMVVAPSVEPEAFGRVAIEAQAMGKIIIATRIGGALETVIDGKTGFLVDVNDVNSLARIIDQVLAMTKNEMELMVQAGVEHIKNNFSNQLMCDKTLEVYKSCLSHKVSADPKVN